jgi:hypothetical protein
MHVRNFVRNIESVQQLLFFTNLKLSDDVCVNEHSYSTIICIERGTNSPT